ncbi:MAG: hypothetical protein INQ03_06780 [Candidatus Heimdallarchaeota archaeon]|nr:hypothetical protein [Candidatus Heimdallarchaeota archaeon]
MTQSSPSWTDTSKEEEELRKLLDSYKELLDSQAQERNLLLEKVNEMTRSSENMNQMENKMDNLVQLLLDIKQQINAISSIKSEISLPQAVMTDDNQVNEMARQLNEEAQEMLDTISTLQERVEQREKEIQEKDNFINELNEQLELLSFEKSQLVSKINSLHQQSEEWGEQVEMLQKLAVSDPRYKAIETLKKHGNLSEIQLAFSMGTSIGQVKRYADDLIKLKLITRDSSGRYVWIGGSE